MPSTFAPNHLKDEGVWGTDFATVDKTVAEGTKGVEEDLVGVVGFKL